MLVVVASFEQFRASLDSDGVALGHQQYENGGLVSGLLVVQKEISKRRSVPFPGFPRLVRQWHLHISVM